MTSMKGTTMLLSAKDIQKALSEAGMYAGPIDGKIGPNTEASIKRLVDAMVVEPIIKWKPSRLLLAAEQAIMLKAGLDVGKVDGLMGPQTQFALEQWQNKQRDIPAVRPPGEKDDVTNLKTKWPYQSECLKFYGPVGQNQTLLTPPYPLYLYDTRTPVTRISVHTKVVGSVERILTKVKETYSEKDRRDLRLDRFFGSLNVRKMRGGSSWSMHSWGIALDFDANRNQLRWGRDRAALAKPIYDKWWAAWEAEGWVSLGREKNYDWMHVQAARI